MNNESKLHQGLTILGVGAIDAYLATKQLPPLATAYVGSVSVIHGLVDRFFNRKFVSFFKEVESVTQQDVEEFHNSMQEDPDDFWANQLEILRRLDNEEKSVINGKLLNAAFHRKISKEDYHRLALIVERLHLSDIKCFAFYYKFDATSDVKDIVFTYTETTIPDIRETIKPMLIANGLLIEKNRLVEDESKTRNMKSGNTQFKNEIEHNVTALGKHLILNAFN